MPESRTCLCIALDFDSRPDFLSAIKSFEELDVVVKVGVRLLPRLLPEDFQKLRDLGIPFFIDAKLYDIPSQVASAVKTWADIGASYLTLHLSSGPAVLKAACEAAADQDITLMGVSVLTSFDSKELLSIGVESSCEEQVARLVLMGKSQGLTSFVSSVAEISIIRKIYPEAFCVCPGIRLDGESQHGDQKRSFTVSEAVTAGANMLVVGRSVYTARNPKEVILKILGDIR